MTMKYCKMDVNTIFNITDFNCKELAFDKQYGIMKDSIDLIKYILTKSLKITVDLKHSSNRLLIVKYYFIRRGILVNKISNLRIMVYTQLLRPNKDSKR
jgi:hypothetical protein